MNACGENEWRRREGGAGGEEAGDEEQVEVQEGPEVQGLPGGLDAVADDACADGGRGRRLSPLPCIA